VPDRAERLGDIYEAMEGRPPDEWGRRFDAHPNAVAPPLSAVGPPGAASPSGSRGGVTTVVRHGRLLFRRRLRLLLRDRPAVVTLVAQTAAVATALAVAFGDLSRVENLLLQARDTVTLLFLLTVSSIWIGCNGAVKALVGERPMYRRERAVNLSPWGYFAATFALHGGVAVAQVVPLAGAVWWLCDPPGMGWPVVGVLALAAVAGTALGLALSAGSESEEQAVAAVPLVLIPQIVFGGAIVALSGFAEWAAKLGISAYWAQRAAATALPPDVANLAGVTTTGRGLALAMLALHAVAFAATAVVIVRVRDARAFKR
jgi:hypothetical protein